MTSEVLSRTSLCVSWCLGKYSVPSVKEGQNRQKQAIQHVFLYSCSPSQVNAAESDVECHATKNFHYMYSKSGRSKKKGRFIMR